MADGEGYSHNLLILNLDDADTQCDPDQPMRAKWCEAWQDPDQSWQGS